MWSKPFPWWDLFRHNWQDRTQGTRHKFEGATTKTTNKDYKELINTGNYEICCKKSLSAHMVIPATTLFNLQCNNFAQKVERMNWMLPVCLTVRLEEDDAWNPVLAPPTQFRRTKFELKTVTYSVSVKNIPCLHTVSGSPINRYLMTD